MKRNAFAIFVIMTFALALIGGGAAGMLLTRLATPKSNQAAPVALTLENLQLTDSQRADIRRIWEGVKKTSDNCSKQARDLDQQCKDKLIGLLTEQQIKEYAKINTECNDRKLKLKADRQRSLKEAIEKTRNLLSDPQRQTYDAILSSRLGPAAGANGGSSRSSWLTSASPATEVSGSNAQQ